MNLFLLIFATLTVQPISAQSFTQLSPEQQQQAAALYQKHGHLLSNGGEDAYAKDVEPWVNFMINRAPECGGTNEDFFAFLQATCGRKNPSAKTACLKARNQMIQDEPCSRDFVETAKRKGAEYLGKSTPRSTPQPLPTTGLGNR